MTTRAGPTSADKAFLSYPYCVA
uniref:Uncharacterized protein n=1 Tax=Arundo donax TaxID=35708 RepID=A0A0A8ZR50_ARUDO